MSSHDTLNVVSLSRNSSKPCQLQKQRQILLEVMRTERQHLVFCKGKVDQFLHEIFTN